VHYVQSHRHQTSLLSENQKTYDGIVEVWMRDLATASAMPTHPDYLRLLREDEPRFIDMSRIHFLMTHQILLRELASSSSNEADRAWSEVIRPTTVKLLQFFPPGHPLIDQAGGQVVTERIRVRDGETPSADTQAIGAYQLSVCRPIREIHGDNPPFGEVREYWWPTLSIFEERAASVAREVLEPRGVTSVLAIAERYK
jgi:hypothetical protein